MSGCSLCKEFSKPYHNAHKEIFEREVQNGMSVRKLEILLKAWSIKSSKSTIARHLKECMKIERKEDIQKEKVSQRMRGFFVRPQFQQKEEEILVKCQFCGFKIKWKDNEGIHYVLLPQRFGSQYCPQCRRAINEFEDSPKENYQTDLKILARLR